MKPCLLSVLIVLFLVIQSLIPSLSGALENEKDIFKKSMELYEAGDFVGSSRILVVLIRKNPRKSLYWFNLGNCAYMVNKYGMAVRYYQKVVSLRGGLSTAGKLYQAKALRMLGKNEQASLLLQDLIAERPTPGILRAATDDLASLRVQEGIDRQGASNFYQERKNRPHWVFFDSSYGSTNNAYLEGKSVAPISSPLVKASIGTGYHFNREQSWSEKIAYILSYENPQNASELQTVLHTLEAPLILRKPNYEMNLIPYFQQQIWNNISVGQKLGAALKNSYGDDDFELGLDIDGFSQKSTHANHAYLNGSSYSFRPYFGIWGDSSYVQIYGLSGVDGSQDITYSDGSRLPLQHTYQGLGLRNMWRISTKASFYFHIAYVQKVYTNPALPENKQRADDETSASLKIAYMIFKKFFIYGTGDYISNKSALVLGDVRDKNYDVSTISVGFSWDAF